MKSRLNETLVLTARLSHTETGLSGVGKTQKDAFHHETRHGQTALAPLPNHQKQ
jgi:hypothetical protein